MGWTTRLERERTERADSKDSPLLPVSESGSEAVQSAVLQLSRDPCSTKLPEPLAALLLASEEALLARDRPTYTFWKQSNEAQNCLSSSKDPGSTRLPVPLAESPTTSDREVRRELWGLELTEEPLAHCFVPAWSFLISPLRARAFARDGASDGFCSEAIQRKAKELQHAKE